MTSPTTLDYWTVWQSDFHPRLQAFLQSIATALIGAGATASVTESVGVANVHFDMTARKGNRNASGGITLNGSTISKGGTTVVCSLTLNGVNVPLGWVASGLQDVSVPGGIETLLSDLTALEARLPSLIATLVAGI